MLFQPISVQWSHARHAPLATLKLCSCSLSCDQRNRPITFDCSHDLPIDKVSRIVLSCYGDCSCKCEGKYLRLMTQGRKNFPTKAAIKRGGLAHDRHTQRALDRYTTRGRSPSTSKQNGDCQLQQSTFRLRQQNFN